MRTFYDRVKETAKKEMGFGREDYRRAMRDALTAQGKETEATRIDQMTGTNRTVTMARELMGQAEETHIKARDDIGLGLPEDRAGRVGHILGALGSDIVQDRGRELWWLINAPQALGNVAQEIALKKISPDLYTTNKVRVDKAGKRLPVGSTEGSAVRDNKTAEALGLTKKGKLQVGYARDSEGYITERKNEPGHLDLLSVPTGLAINTGIGLMNPFGGAEGYKAVLPSEEDPSKTSNVLGEVAAKYILGRTGDLLPWDEFKKVRPDVSKGEYQKYKAYKFSKEEDWNPLDGDVNILTGVLRGTTEGIHGPEVQFLGRSLPVSTAIMPTAAGVLGTAYGSRLGPKKGLGIGIASTLGAMGIGNLIEGERRRRNAAENERGRIDTIN
jgi:hypothetical protein